MLANQLVTLLLTVSHEMIISTATSESSIQAELCKCTGACFKKKNLQMVNYLASLWWLCVRGLGTRLAM